MTLECAPASDDDRNKNQLLNLLPRRFQFRDDGRRLFSLRWTLASVFPSQPKDYEVIVQVWDATPLPDLRDLLAGRVQPANNRERLRLITLCKRQHRYVAASRFYNDAFAAEPSLADDVTAGHRYDAACCDLGAAAGHGIDADKLDDHERTRLRQEAIGWLRADLDAWRQQLDNTTEYYSTLGTLRRWQKDADLAGIRDKDAMAKLPAEQRQACQQLWTGVDALLQADAHYQRGFDLETKKQWADAIAAYRKAAELNPASGLVYLRLALALEASKEWDGAIAAYRKVVDLYPRAQNYARLSLALEARSLLDEANAAFQKAMELNPKTAARVYLERGQALKVDHRLDDAIAALRRGIEADPKDSRIYMELGRALHDQQHWDEAIAVFRKAIAINPQWAWVHNNIGLTLAEKNQLDDAIAEFRIAIELSPDYSDAYGNLAWLLQRQGKWDEGIAAGRKAIELSPRVGWYHNDYGWGLEHVGKFEEALAEYRTATKLPNVGSNAAVNLKNLEPLVPLLRRLEAVRKGEARPTDAAECLQLAHLAKRKNQWPLAIRLYDDAFSDKPDLAAAVSSSNRYSAACHAVLAAVSRDFDQRDDKERALLRQKAVAWLRRPRIPDQASRGRQTERPCHRGVAVAALAGGPRPGRHSRYRRRGETAGRRTRSLPEVVGRRDGIAEETLDREGRPSGRPGPPPLPL